MPEGFTREMSPLDTFRISLQILGSIMSIYGILWVFIKFQTKKILRNTAGYLIVSISVADLVASLQYCYTSLDYVFMIWRYLSDEFGYYLGIWMYHLFNWALLSAAQWEITLALHTLYVIRGGLSTKMMVWKWPMIVLGVIGPILYFFWPISIYTGEPLFQAWSSEQGINYFLLGSISILMVVGFLAFLLIYRNMSIYTIKYTRGSKMPSAAAQIVLRIVMVYSLSMLVAFGPFWLKTLIFTIDRTNSESDYIYNYPVSFGSFVLILKDMTSPFRGYIHALAVYFVYMTTNPDGSKKSTTGNYFCYLLLLDIKPKVANERSIDRVETRVNPQWSFTFNRNMVDSVQTVETDASESFLSINRDLT